MVLEVPEWFLAEGSTPIPITSKRNGPFCPRIKPTPNAPSPPEGEPRFQGRPYAYARLMPYMSTSICWCSGVTSCEALMSLAPPEEVVEEDYSILGKTSWSQSWLVLGAPLEKLHKLLHCPMPVKMSVRAITFSPFPLTSYWLSLIAVANVTGKDNWYTPK